MIRLVSYQLECSHFTTQTMRLRGHSGYILFNLDYCLGTIKCFVIQKTLSTASSWFTVSHQILPPTKPQMPPPPMFIKHYSTPSPAPDTETC